MKATFRKLLDEEFAPYRVFRVGDYTVYTAKDMENKKYIAYYWKDQLLKEGEVGLAESIGQDPVILDVKDKPRFIDKALARKYLYNDAFVNMKQFRHLIKAINELRAAKAHGGSVIFEWIDKDIFTLKLLGANIILSKLTTARDFEHSIRVPLKNIDLLTYSPHNSAFFRTSPKGRPLIVDLNESEKHDRVVLVFSQEVVVC